MFTICKLEFYLLIQLLSLIYLLSFLLSILSLTSELIIMNLNYYHLILVFYQ